MLDSRAFIAARKSKGLSQKQLAAAARVSQQLITSIETGLTRTTKYLLRLAKALDVRPGELDPEWTNLAPDDERGAVSALFGRLPGGVPGSAPVGPAQRDLPIHASAEDGAGFIIVNREAADFMPRPPPVAHVRRAYGLYVTGESMVPEFEPGDIAIVNPHLPVVADTTCVFYAAREDESRATIKRLRRGTADSWQLRQWSPPKDFTLPRKDWPTCHRVVGKYSRG